ncbi:hypothetical protein BBO_08287 [Beauveria brongniartii RCEF 3172]|uniref:Uncharacterized protein n=1 Tax=Beauveria brongniartii RCEF 3172 TaxID=1081107 RepID=A0A166S4L4_9HYPO|nr:hypothetical protein BBO_08287 [Beauveria brongniartii RCEF 3172]
MSYGNAQISPADSPAYFSKAAQGSPPVQSQSSFSGSPAHSARMPSYDSHNSHGGMNRAIEAGATAYPGSRPNVRQSLPSTAASGAYQHQGQGYHQTLTVRRSVADISAMQASRQGFQPYRPEDIQQQAQSRNQDNAGPPRPMPAQETGTGGPYDGGDWASPPAPQVKLRQSSFFWEQK